MSSFNALELADKVVFISAGASGIGRVVAKMFLSHGAKVHVCDLNPKAIEEFLEQCPNATATVADISNFAQVEAIFEDISSIYGRLDILINNAGIAGPTGSVEDIDPKEWQQCIDIDINGQFYCTKLAVPMLRAAGGGSIVNMSSNAAFYGFPLRSPYCASKWALIGLTKTWAMELGQDKIRVNALCPGSVQGPRIDGVIARDAKERGVSEDVIKDIYSSQSSLRVFVTPEEVANMMLFLCSPLGANISGQMIGIDGHTEHLSNQVFSL